MWDYEVLQDSLCITHFKWDARAQLSTIFTKELQSAHLHVCSSSYRGTYLELLLLSPTFSCMDKTVAWCIIIIIVISSRSSSICICTISIIIINSGIYIISIIIILLDWVSVLFCSFLGQQQEKSVSR